jgi:hypothetical protein
MESLQHGGSLVSVLKGCQAVGKTSQLFQHLLVGDLE